MRPELDPRHPVYVVLTIDRSLGSLRAEEPFACIQKSLAKGCDRFGMRVVDFSVQDWSIYLMVEAEDKRALSRGIQGLSIRIARAVNRHWSRKGRVFVQRFAAKALETVGAVRSAITHIHETLQRRRGERAVDPYSSANPEARWWQRSIRIVVEPRTLLLVRVKAASAAAELAELSERIGLTSRWTRS